MSFARSHLLAPWLLLAFTARAVALHIEFDYASDSAHGNYFATHDAARLALEKAAADLGDVITTPLGAITTNSFTGIKNANRTTFNWTVSVINPSTGLLDSPVAFTRLADTVVVHVGFRAFPDDRLGGAKVDEASKTIDSPLGGTLNDRVTATGIAEGASNAMISRGSVPVMGSVGGSFGGVFYNLRYGPLGGSLWFDSDIDNAPDNKPDWDRLDEYWQFDATAPVEAGKVDFYSVALRGLVHTLGFGEGDAWAAQAKGASWKGEHVMTLLGSDGTGLIQTDGQIAQGLGGANLFNGSWQLAAMSPGLAAGERRYLTALDVAFIQDLGYQTIPEPAGVALLFLGGALLGGARFRLVRRALLR